MNNIIKGFFLIGLLCLLPVYADTTTVYQVAIPSHSATTELSLEQALHKLLAANLSAEILNYEALQADASYQRYQTKFSPFISASVAKQKTNLDPVSLDAVYGTRFDKDESALSIGKSFQTGTTVIGGYKDTRTNYAEPSTMLTGRYTDWHSTALFLQIKQDLLKNSFGYNDRLQNEILQNVTTSKQQVIESQLSGLMVSGIFDYWSVAEKQKKLTAAEGELAAYQKIYAAVAKNVDIGLYDKYNLYQFNALIAGSEAKLAMAQLNYQKAAHKMLRNINMTTATNNAINFVSLTNTTQNFDAQKLYTTALEKRADLKQLTLALNSSEKQIALYGNQELPDLQLQWQGTGLGVDDKLDEANKESGKTKYANWETRLTMSKILFDNDTSIQKRNAEYQYKQITLQIQNLKNQIKDEVTDGVATAQTAYISVEKTRIMVDDSEKYLQALLLRLKQGRLSTLELKSAVDMLVMANNNYADAVTGYNMALLNLDLVTNTVFEKYNININKTIKELH